MRHIKRFLIVIVGLLCILSIHAEVKYVFYFIGDGMGPNQVLLTEMYQAEMQGKIGRVPLRMTQFPYGGLLATYSAKHGVTDSSAAGTALACGEKAINGQVGLNAQGDTLQSIAEALKEAGWAVGVSSSASVDHATPASFYANSDKRGDYYAIAGQLIKTNFEFVGGGDFVYPTGKQKDQPSLFTIAEENGYTIVRGIEAYEACKKKLSKDTKAKIMLFQEQANSSLPQVIDAPEKGLRLPDIVSTGIDFLSQHDRFFLMVESGEIDWAAHSDDARTVIDEVIEFDKSIQVAYDFYLQHPDETLIIATADHETGGLVIGRGSSTLHLEQLQHQKASIGIISNQIQELHKQKGKEIVWDDVRAVLSSQLGLYEAVKVTEKEDKELQEIFQRSQRNEDTSVKTLYKTFSELSAKALSMLNKKAGLGWTSTSHSATPVPIFTVGVGAERFSGLHDNTEIKGLILDIVQ